jgi:uracil-DNA glycosylase
MSGSADDTGERQAALEALLADIASCRICRDAPLGGPANALPHEPRPVCVASSRAPILIAGQAPGTRVHQSGRPFTDPSGDRLRDWLGVDEAQFYDPDNFAIVPMGFCFPGRRQGRRSAAAARMRAGLAGPADGSHAAGQADPGDWAVCPGLASGRCAGTSLTETVRRLARYSLPAAQSGCAVLPLPHPSWRNSGWIKRNPWFEAELLPELKGGS